DKDLLSRLHGRTIAKTLQGGEPRDRYRGSLLEREVRRLPLDCLGRHHALRERAALAAVHLVTGLEVVDAVADRLDDAGEVAAQLARLRLPEAHQRACDVG